MSDSAFDNVDFDTTKAQTATRSHCNRYYDDRAQKYAERTLPASQPPLLDAFIAGLEPGSRVLDLGCGAGRDLLTLRKAGFDCLGVDLSAQLARIARAHTEAPVLDADMRSLHFPDASFAGIVAIASLLHLSPGDQALQVDKIFGWLQPGGLFLATLKIGSGSEITTDARGFTYIEPLAWLAMLRADGFEILRHQVTPGSDSVSSSAHDWLAVLAKKP
ncbi:class I SAM-dependent DNA methyltransferase [Sphingomonas sp. MS122]|uniref:class I SAM-dependent DNA methyltransferase n=1 Tax=Sphingomonas sp. MS122 TaxID=3412683 RepID=UPI003C2D7957